MVLLLIYKENNLQIRVFSRLCWIYIYSTISFSLPYPEKYIFKFFKTPNCAWHSSHVASNKSMLEQNIQMPEAISVSNPHHLFSELLTPCTLNKQPRHTFTLNTWNKQQYKWVFLLQRLHISKPVRCATLDYIVSKLHCWQSHCSTIKK